MVGLDEGVGSRSACIGLLWNSTERMFQVLSRDDPESLHDMTQDMPVPTEMPSPTSPGGDDDEDRITCIANHKL